MRELELIEWIGDDRMVPGCGMGRKGRVLSVSPEQARSFIDQKLAKAYTVPKVSKTKTEEADDHE